MATYNKRGYKAPKPEEVKVETDVNDIENTINVDEKDSTTANVLNTLDETASKTEEFVAKNQNIILSIVGGIALLTAGYLLYNKFVSGPKESEAASDMFQAQQYFKKAVEGTGTASDSLYNLALNGGDGKQGFLDIIKTNSGTDAGNLAEYYAGMALLNTKKFQAAIDHLSNFKSEDAFTSAMAIGAIGDANAELKKPEQALEFYVKAAESNKNEMTTPRFLLKAGQTAMSLGKKADALKYFTDIKDNFEVTPEAQNIDALIGMAQ
ncbi:tol-pal system YbgF family protein [Flavobacterium sp.]|uniref:tetratricopeptide repeat protein n=1 Tax=Flavobacterium sp. TaxID=239 RepID=UPI00374D1687